jgi:hypothetical protein
MSRTGLTVVAVAIAASLLGSSHAVSREGYGMGPGVDAQSEEPDDESEPQTPADPDDQDRSDQGGAGYQEGHGAQAESTLDADAGSMEDMEPFFGSGQARTQADACAIARNQGLGQITARVQGGTSVAAFSDGQCSCGTVAGGAFQCNIQLEARFR